MIANRTKKKKNTFLWMKSDFFCVVHCSGVEKKSFNTKWKCYSTHAAVKCQINLSTTSMVDIPSHCNKSIKYLIKASDSTDKNPLDRADNFTPTTRSCGNVLRRSEMLIECWTIWLIYWSFGCAFPFLHRRHAVINEINSRPLHKFLLPLSIATTFHVFNLLASIKYVKYLQ